jgi:hypothetical protein
VQQRDEVGGQRRAAHQPFSGDRMDELQLDAGQEEAAATEHVVEEPVVAALAVGRIANDRVGEVLEMAPQLVAPAGERLELDQRIPAGRVRSTRCGSWTVARRRKRVTAARALEPAAGVPSAGSLPDASLRIGTSDRRLATLLPRRLSMASRRRVSG